jgi:hypothetical protein
MVARPDALRSVRAGAILAAAILGFCDLVGVATADNQRPDPPFLVSPVNGVIVHTLRPPLAIANASDPDGDPLVYDWDLARDEGFAMIAQGGSGVPADEGPVTTFQLARDLIEDIRYCWRARSDDSQATSEYSEACFVASERNDPPSVPVLNNPSDQQGANTTTPVFSWAPSTDPEGEPITYELEVEDEAGTLIDRLEGITGTLTQIPTELAIGVMYAWRARAADRSGASSAFSPYNTFAVELPCDAPDVCEDHGCSGVVCYDGCTGRPLHSEPSASSDDCGASGAPGTGSLIILGACLGSILRPRRRNSRVRAPARGRGGHPTPSGQ